MVSVLPGNGVSAPHDSTPSFAPRKGVLLQEYHVLVVWPDGRRLKVGRFPRRCDAARWITQKSALWLDHFKADGPAE